MLTTPLDEPATPPARRDLTFDILKGIGILEVMLHHLLAYSTRKFAVAGAPEWWAYTLANRILHFAVPTFLLASALLLARSMASKPRPDWRRYYLRRAQRSLWPYLLWSVVYLLFRVYVLKIGSDVIPTTARLPLLGEVTGPTVLADASQWVRNMVWGKAYYHLYFMSVLLQFTLFFPLLFHGMRHLPLSFGHLLTVAFLLQGGVYYLQARVFYPRFGFTTPGSMALWYLPALLTGAWIGLNWKQWPDVWRKWKLVIALVAAAGFALYFGLSLLQLLGKPIPSLGFNSGATVYASGMALLLLKGSSRLAAVPFWGRSLARIGDRSLPLFLLHPLTLHFLSGPKVGGMLDFLPLSPLWAGLLLFAVTWGLIDLGQKAGVNALLFGRTFPTYAPAAGDGKTGNPNAGGRGAVKG